MPLAPGATAVDTNPPANHFEPFHFPVLPRPISREEAQFPTNTVNQDGTDAWLLGGTGEPSAQQPTRIPPEPFTRSHSIFKKQCGSVPPKYRDKHSWAKLQAAERESNVESAGFHRGPENRLLPVMDAGFKTHRPKRQMTVVTRGLKISSLYHLHKEIFPDTGGLRQINTYKMFWFENMWLLQPDFHAVIRSSWATNEFSTEFGNKLVDLQETISTWKRETYGNLYASIEKLYRRIAGIQNSPSYPTSSFLQNLERELLHEVFLKKIQNEIFWYQRSQVISAEDNDTIMPLPNEEEVHRFGFSDLVIQRLLTCVSSVQFRVLLNGQPSEAIQPTRGLRQGDPIFPYLYLLCSEALAASLQKLASSQPAFFPTISPEGDRINYLQYADNTVVPFGVEAGQKIDLAKSSITFSRDTPRHLRRDVKSALGIHNEQGSFLYLGEQIGLSSRRGPESAIAAPTDWWLPPPPGWLKLNFHSAFNRFTQQARVGGAICDPFGNLITTFSGDIRAAHPLEAELIALQRGLLRCHDLQLSNIQARGTYSNEQDRVTAYTRAFFSDLMNDASASSNAPTRVRVDPSNAIPSRGFEQGGCSYSAHHANGE
ncbi:hypothetical protein MRB53_002322 [Persea americana]|uniref:Uncharacterized protein n=1 Tax=Persea americana TaxID=3435 RepID=A0ACC2MU98_PERAE|nr:hypothetical protein MRB53_002322 [Persea americana]